MEVCSTVSEWAALTTEQRCRRVAKVATTITEAAEELVSLCQSEQRVDPADTLGAELVPFCAALKFLGQRGPRILRSRHHGVSGRPLWMWGIQSTVHRVPLGTVLVLGTWNYPLLLVGTQAAQALAAGNQVIIKPAIGSEQVTARMVQAFHDAGVPETALRQIDSSTESAIAAIDQGVDLIVLTGAAATGRKVLTQAAQSLTPTIMELSGCDAVILLPDADLNRAAEAIRFGINVNSGATCIGPRRLLVSNAMADLLTEALHVRLANVEPMVVHPSARNAVADTLDQALKQGATDRFNVVDTELIRNTGQMSPVVLDNVQPDHEVASADLFAPITSIIRVDQVDQAVKIVNECPYRLGASVFGPPKLAQMVAARLQTGGVIVNDLIMPTADPRLPFGGRGQSGFGVTRGEEGLLAMTTPKVVSRRRGRHALHLAPRREEDTEALYALLQILHAGSLSRKLGGVKRLIGSRKR